MDIKPLEERLRSERADLAQTLEHLNAAFSVPQTEESGEISVVDQHNADIATDTELRELDLMRRKFVEDRIALIDGALERIQRGSYGRCVVCDAEIQEERLEALPWTPYCLTHAAIEGTPSSPPPARRR